MQKRTQSFKSALLAVLITTLFPQADLTAADRYADIENKPIEDIVHFMTRTRARKASPAKSRIITKADEEPAFREELVSALTKRLSEVTARIKISNTVRALPDLNARETLPQLQKIWNETEKKTYGLEFADLRIQLLTTITQWLPEEERIKFLIDTESDTTEAPKVRFRATVLLCADGNGEGINHILSVYESQKQQFPLTTCISLEKQDKHLRRIDELDNNHYPGDSDKDLMSSYIEKGLLLDPENVDTDGDGLLDGNDRNPLCKPQTGQLSEDQQIAHFILYLHARYYRLSRSPFNFKLLIVQPVDTWDGKGNQSLFDGMQFTGIDGLVLHMDKKQIDRFRSIHGYGTYAISIHKELESAEQKDIKEFHLSTSGGPGLFRTYDITFKRINNQWLPVHWQLGIIT